MKTQIRDRYSREEFFPSWLGVFVNPFYFARRGLAQSLTRWSVELSGRLLDVGCGTKPYRALFATEDYVGLDIDSERTRALDVADVLYDGGEFPFPDQSFDSALCNQVLEHVFNPEAFLSEIHRVLVPGGKLLLTVPFVWDEHEQPWDYARYSSFGLDHLLDRAGFTIREHEKIGADAGIIWQMTNAYLFKLTNHFPKVFRLMFTVTVMAWINISGIVASRLLPRNPDLYLDHIVVGVKR